MLRRGAEREGKGSQARSSSMGALRPGGARRQGARRRERAVLIALCVGVFATAPRRVPAGTVAEQRARLPPPADCGDPVEGIWKSHDYDKRWGEWTIFTLEVRRVEGSQTALNGKIFNHSWFGDDDKPQPGPCDGRLRFKVSMDAEGTIQDGQINFHGIGEWRMDEVVCGEWNAGYNLDNFTGRIDPETQEFQSKNNDGGRAVNDPTVFRRVKCFDQQDEDEDEGPRVGVTPPAFYPPQEETGGCGCRL